MSRNRLMRASAFLLVSTMVTSCFVGSTFAKYVSEGTGSAEARVAKWGVDVQWEGDLFYSVYNDNNGQAEVDGNGSFVVAPGTKSREPLQLTISGTPEVRGEYTTTVDIDFGDGWMIKPDGEPLEEGEAYGGDQETVFYCPLKFTINDTPGSAIDGSKYTSADDLVSAINQALQPLLTGTFDANETLNETLKLDWEWPFEGGKSTGQTDAKDTYLGNKAADEEPSNDPTIVIDVTTRVEQVD